MRILGPKLKRPIPKPTTKTPVKFNPKWILPKKRSCCGK